MQTGKIYLQQILKGGLLNANCHRYIILNPAPQPTLTTDRLLLRRFMMDDAQAMYDKWASDPSAVRCLTWNVHRDVEETKEILRAWITEQDRPYTYRWAITLDGELIGMISCRKIDTDTGRGELGYVLSRSFWNQGIMPEAVRAVIGFFFTDVHFNCVCISHVAENAGSGRVAEKCGMQCEGTPRAAFATNADGIRDLKIWSILREEWERI